MKGNLRDLAKLVDINQTVSTHIKEAEHALDRVYSPRNLACLQRVLATMTPRVKRDKLPLSSPARNQIQLPSESDRCSYLLVTHKGWCHGEWRVISPIRPSAVTEEAVISSKISIATIPLDSACTFAHIDYRVMR